MGKTILITGATDGIGLETAVALSQAGHDLLLHGRNQKKLDALVTRLGRTHRAYVADLSDLAAVRKLAQDVRKDCKQLDVLINNAGVLKTAHPVLPNGMDIRFVVNTVAPYLLTRLLLPVLGSDSRVVNLSSAAQAPVQLDALTGAARVGDMDAYSQSKLAITMWTQSMAAERSQGPLLVSVNPGSLLASKMVREGFGVAGHDIGIGVDILCRAALSDEFAGRSGDYFDNDAGHFAPPHSTAGGASQAQLMDALDRLVADRL